VECRTSGAEGLYYANGDCSEDKSSVFSVNGSMHFGEPFGGMERANGKMVPVNVGYCVNYVCMGCVQTSLSVVASVV
jgi:hypothetical protein